MNGRRFRKLPFRAADVMEVAKTHEEKATKLLRML